MRKETIMHIAAFRKEHIPEAAELFLEKFNSLQKTTSEVAGLGMSSDQVADNLNWLIDTYPCFVALEKGKLQGYLGGLIAENFRRTSRRAAYCPVWGHAATSGKQAAVYPPLYRSAAEQWAAAGCQIHALTMLANDPESEKAWFWNGFGLIVVDAVRKMEPIHTGAIEVPEGFLIRTASLQDVKKLCVLDAEHCQHYSASPIFMVTPEVSDEDEITEFLSQPENSVWIALYGSEPVGFIRFAAQRDVLPELISSTDGVAINGAYIRPMHRGIKLASAILNAALKDYASRGFVHCSVDFESFNPEAVNFWMRFFNPICLSVARVPET